MYVSLFFPMRNLFTKRMIFSVPVVSTEKDRGPVLYTTAHAHQGLRHKIKTSQQSFPWLHFLVCLWVSYIFQLTQPAARAKCIDCVGEREKGVFNDSELPTSNLQRSIREVTKRIFRIMLFFSLKPLMGWLYEGRLSFMLLYSAPPDHGEGSRKNKKK